MLSTGFAVSSVKQAAAREGVTTDAMDERFASEGSPVPKLIVRAVRCTYAAVLRRRTGASWREIASLTRYGKPETLLARMRACFGSNLLDLELQRRGEPASVVIGPRIEAWLDAQAPAQADGTTRRRARGIKASKQASTHARKRLEALALG
jgi:hypothetical protein